MFWEFDQLFSIIGWWIMDLPSDAWNVIDVNCPTYKGVNLSWLLCFIDLIDI